MIGRGRLRISQDLLRDALGISDKHSVTDVYRTMKDVKNNTFSIVVVGPDLPEAAEGGPVKGVIALRSDGRRFMSFKEIER